MPTLTHVSICKYDEENFCTKTVYVAVCHHCKEPELVVADVEVQGYKPENYPSSVACGACGMRGPWGKTEEEAVDKWNKWAGLEKEDIDDFEWECTPLSELRKNEAPF